MAFGLVSLPLYPLAGWLSDHLGRKRLIVFSFLLSFAGRCAFIPASRLWHFWAATALISCSAVSEPVKTAWASDLAPRESMGRAISQMSVSGWAGGVVGNVLGGLAIEGLGVPWTYAATALSTLVAIGLLLAMRASPLGRVSSQVALSSPSDVG
jgi:MFS family permease